MEIYGANAYPYKVRVPRVSVDETTMGEWLERRRVDYVAPQQRQVARDDAYEFRFSSQRIADEFARNFIG